MTTSSTWDLIDAEVREYSSRSGEDRAYNLFLQAIAAAEARGYARAKEQAHGVAERCRAERETLATNEFAADRSPVARAALDGKWSEAERIRDAIRAMKDEGGA